MKDHHGKIFYVGKAINLRSRVRSYFSGQDTRPFVAWLKHILADIETIVVRNNTESLLLERTLINQHKPKYNIQLRDNKQYILLKLKKEKYPRLEMVRQIKNDGARYFGPYPSASQIRNTLHLINKHFHLRTCQDKVLHSRKRPCIQYQIGRCPAPCVQEIPHYSDEINNVVAFLNGQGREVEKRLTEQMTRASENENFELAALLRDQLRAIETSLGKQVVIQAGRLDNEDVIAFNRTGHLLEIVQMKIREGMVLSSHHFAFDNQEFPSDELLLTFLTQLYEHTDKEQLPKQVLLSIELEIEKELLPVEVKTPVRGKLKALVNIAQRNADKAMTERLRQHEVQAASLQALQKCLGIQFSPKVIECFDISLFQGTDAVASQVCFTDGKANKSRYRLYTIKTVVGTDDYAMHREALTRRLTRGLKENNLPDLLLVDGGKGQLNVALAVCKDLNIQLDPAKFYVAGMAKDPERIFLPNAKDPIVLKSHTAERYLLERIRDEAHRFAITAHRHKRKKRTLHSAIDQIPGVGPQKRRDLLKHFGSVEAITKASTNELCLVPGIGSELAKQIHHYFL